MGHEEARASGTAGVQVANKIDEAKNKARDIAQDAKRQGREKLESGKETAANQTEKLADVLERAAEELKDGELQSLSDYAAQLAGGMRTFVDNVRGKSLDELLSDTRQLARKNPAMFFVGSVALGLAFSRFLKASKEGTPGNDQNRKYGSSTDAAVQPAVFERGPAVLPETRTPSPESSDTPSFADDLKKGI
jgi:alanyl-tRNA synthetase